MPDRYRDVVRAYSVALLGLALVVAAVGTILLDAPPSVVDLVEVALPVLTGVGIVVAGIRLERAESPDAVGRIGAWTVGGVVVGQLVILWFTFLVSLEQAPTAEPVVLHLNSTSIAMAAGVVVGYFSLQSTQTTRGLRETNRRLEAVMRTVEAIIFIKDADGRYQLMNEQCREVLGIDDDESIVGKTDYDLFPADVAEEFRQDDEHVLETGETIRTEEEVPTPDGTRTHLTLKSPLRDADGNAHGICAVATDISARKERERELNARSTAMAASIDGMAILDEDGEYVFVNEAHVSVYGYDDPDAFIGESWQMCYHDEELERFETAVLPELEASGGWLGEAIGLRKDGSTFPQELSLSLLEDGGMVCVVRDISERKSYREELERQNARLEEFASVLSHDLRNPLNVAAGQIEIARAERESEALEEAGWAIDRMHELIEDVLALARQGSQVGETEPVDVRTVCVDCWRSVETDGATLDVESTLVVDADRSRFKQLLENLLRNAVEHGGDDVHVRVGDCDGGFFVADDGVGIDDADLNAVFDRGYSTGETGTGFGLPIVREIAVAHGWDVALAESESGGARFEITGVSPGGT
jgi:PAS domain S-box-containing protein